MAIEFYGNVLFLGLARASGDRALVAKIEYQGHVSKCAKIMLEFIPMLA
jgi:hypothetical protein